MKRFWNITRYILIIVLDVAMMWLFQSYLNFLFLIALLVFPIYSAYGLHRVKNAFSLELQAPLESMEKGSTFLVKIKVHNPTAFPLLNATVKLELENTFHREDGVHFLNIPIRAHADTVVEYPIVMDYSGCFVVNTQYIELVDLLGLFEKKIEISKSASCLTTPIGDDYKEEAGYLYVQGVSETMESNNKGVDFSEVSGVREYIPGDKLQNIHWKLSVKKDEWMVKERVSMSAVSLHILLELYNDEQMCADSVLDLAQSVTKSLVSQNLPFTIYYYSANLGELNSYYVGSEQERKEWMEMVLYDRCYKDELHAKHLFCQQHAGAGSYLYIGLADGAGNPETMILGKQGSVAVLCEC